jgi:hypothetical protein
MPRPTIDHLLDQQIQLWRPSTAQDSVGVEERGYVAADVVAAKINAPVLPSEAAQGGGMAEVLRVRWYGRPDVDVRERDVCEVVAGPETGKRYEVNAKPVRMMGHHTQVDCVEFNGSLPVDS